MRIGFDFSGTLADDMAAVYAATRGVLDSMKMEVPPLEVWRASGCANITEFLAHFRIPLEPCFYKDRLHEVWSKNVRSGVAAPVAYEGVSDLLRELKAKKHELYLVSCCWQDVLEAAVRDLGWDGLFVRVIGGLENKRETIAALGLDLYVGDTLGDLRACEGLAPFLAVAYGYGQREQLAAAGPGPIVETPRELAALLRSCIELLS